VTELYVSPHAIGSTAASLTASACRTSSGHMRMLSSGSTVGRQPPLRPRRRAHLNADLEPFTLLRSAGD